MASNYPLRGGKASIWEGGLRGIGFVTAGDPAKFGIQVAALCPCPRGCLHNGGNAARPLPCFWSTSQHGLCAVR